jgi:hypothetical protein
MKLLRAIRLDPSDTFIFDTPAEPGEVVVVGSFLFWDEDLQIIAGKRRAAFRSGFLGIESFGHSTLASVAEIDDAAYAVALQRLAEQLVTHCGAPDVAAALPAAAEEMAFAMSLADHAPETVIAMHRMVENGAIRERFRTLERRAALEGGLDQNHARVFSFMLVEGEEEPAESVDLVGMAQRGKSGS